MNPLFALIGAQRKNSGDSVIYNTMKRNSADDDTDVGDYDDFVNKNNEDDEDIK